MASQNEATSPTSSCSICCGLIGNLAASVHSVVFWTGRAGRSDSVCGTVDVLGVIQWIANSILPLSDSDTDDDDDNDDADDDDDDDDGDDTGSWSCWGWFRIGQPPPPPSSPPVAACSFYYEPVHLSRCSRHRVGPAVGTPWYSWSSTLDVLASSWRVTRTQCGLLLAVNVIYKHSIYTLRSV